MMLLAKTRLRLRTSPKPFRALYDGCGRYSGKQASSSVSPEKWSGRGHNRAFSHFTGTRRARWQTVIRGIRLSVEFVIGLMADGWSEADILRDLPGSYSRRHYRVSCLCARYLERGEGFRKYTLKSLMFLSLTRCCPYLGPHSHWPYRSARTETEILTARLSRTNGTW